MIIIQAYSTRDRCIAPTLLRLNASWSFAELFFRQEALNPQDHKAAACLKPASHLGAVVGMISIGGFLCVLRPAALNLRLSLVWGSLLGAQTNIVF